MGFALGLLASCGPSKEEIETKEALISKNNKYKVGNVVYLKPDSCAGVITAIKVSFDYGGINDYDSAYIYYVIRDCHGLDITAKQEFIYGLKHR